MDTEIDKIDRKILNLLQSDATLSLSDLAEAVNLTTTPCWKRLKSLKVRALSKSVSPCSIQRNWICFSLLCFVKKTSDHSHEWYSQFVSTASDFPEVMEFYRMAGEYDYMMKVLVKDMQCFDTFYKKLVNLAEGSQMLLNLCDGTA